ncbi:hypothetical protein RI367_003886 [Sorochytrium milnesiophthora]
MALERVSTFKKMLPPFMTTSSAVAILLSAVLAVWTVRQYSFSVWFGPKRRPPGPQTNQFWRLKDLAMRGEMHVFFKSLLDEYGDFVSAKIRATWLFIIADASLAKAVLSDNDTYIRLEAFTAACNSAGPMLFAINGPMWKGHRKSISPAFATGHLRSALPVIVHFTDKLCQRIDEELDKSGSSDSGALNVHALYSTMTLDVFGKAFFGYDFHAMENPDGVTYRAAESIASGIMIRSAVPKWLWPFLVRDNFYQAAETVRGVIMSAIESKLQSLAEQGEGALLEKEKLDLDLLDNLLLATQKEKDPISQHELTSEMIGLFMAGHETTANTLTFATQALADHPDIAQELREEISQVVGEKQITLDIVAQLRKLDLFLKEVMRFYPVVPAIPRTATRETSLGGYPIPRGSRLSVNVQRLHRNPKYWKDPNTFILTRFETDTIVPGSYIPFGDGPHKCIGERLAALEAKVVLAKLISRFQPKLEANQSFRLVTSVTLGYKEGLFVRFHPVSD